MPLPSIIIIGGGVAGLTAAHELKERGFSVTVYERQSSRPAPGLQPGPILGGKARSYPVPPDHAQGWDNEDEERMIVGLPAEHGFRFFPSFYQHIIDTFHRIPVGQDRYVFDNLVSIEHAAYALEGRPFFRFPTKRPDTLRQFWKALQRFFLTYPGLGLAPAEAAFAAGKLVNAMTMCDGRREAELEQVSWWNYMDADDMSDAYRTAIVNGLTKNFVAMDARYSSTKSVINILARLLNDLMTPGHTVDRILNGPTSEVWIDHWRSYLETAAPGQPAVQFVNAEVTSFEFDPIESRIGGVNLSSGIQRLNRNAHYILAVPVEAAIKILDSTAAQTPEIFEHAPSLKLIKELKVNWMTGIVYYLLYDVEMCPGHVVYLNSSWAITSISQNQFWRKKIKEYGQAGDVDGDVSAIISDWDAPGTKVWRRPAREAPGHKEIAREARAEIRAHLTALSRKELSKHDKKLSENDRQLGDSNIVGYCLDLAIYFKSMLLGLMSAREFTNRQQSWHDVPHVAQLHAQVDKMRDPGFLPRVENTLEELRPTRGAALINALFDQLLGEYRGALAAPLRTLLLKPGMVDELEDKLRLLPVREWPSLIAAFIDRILLADNQEPLFINTIGSWFARPPATTSIENLFLASDYVKTTTDLATMEGANEAGRRAVNGILDAEGSKRARCELFQFEEPAVLAPFKAIDKELFERGLPHPSFLVAPFFSFGARIAGQARKWAKGTSV